MRVNSVRQNNFSKGFKANPTGVAKNCKKAIKKMNIYGGSSIGIGTIGAVTLLTTGCLLAGFACLIPTFLLMNQFDKEAQKYQGLVGRYNKIKERAKNIYA